eukprot:c24360_g1_i1 orf=593-3931(+)
MEISSFVQEEGGRIGARTLSDISIASNASGKAQNLSSFGAPKYVRDARVKFLCSHGGRIFPRPSDKRLRYVGGETRMISVPRHININAFQLKLAEIYGPDVTLKYQLPEEDLDALVSVSSDEDLENMMEECDRLDAMEGSSRLRVFVFSPLDHEAIDLSDIADPKISEHRYVEAVNTVQVDVSLRQSDNMTDFYRNSSELCPSYGSNTATMQERVSPSSENLHSQVFPIGQFLPGGNIPMSKYSSRNNVSGHTGPPPRAAVTRQWNEVVPSQHANNLHSHGILVDGLLDQESGESASSSASSQHDLYHRHRWGSNNSQKQSHLEPFGYRNDEDQKIRAEQRQMMDARGRGETLDRKVPATLAAPFLPTGVIPEMGEQLYGLDNVSEVKNPVMEMHEDQPLSPGSLLQRQLQEDQHHLETNYTHFRKEDSQSSSDGNSRQPSQTFQLLHERQQIEQLPLHNPGNVFTQEGVLAGGHLLSDPLNLPGFVPQPFTESPPVSFSQTYPVDINKESGLADFLQQGHPSATVSSDQRALNALDSGSASQAWLAPDLVSFPPGENAQVEGVHQNGVQNASGITANQLVGAGLSLLDQPVDHENKIFSATVSDVKVGPAMRHCSNIDIMPDALTSGPLLTCFTPQFSQAVDLVSTLLNPLAKLNAEEMSLPLVADGISGFLPKRSFEDTKFGVSQGVDSLKQPMYKENAAGFSEAGETVLSSKGILDITNDKEAKITAETLQSSSSSTCTSRRELWSAKLQHEHEQHTVMLHASHEQDAKEIESSFAVQKELTIENSKLEVEEEDTYKSAAEGPMNAAAIAEAEAIARGLQTIRNFDLEELRELGSGTFGTVYYGKWRGTDVAIKRIKSSCFTGKASERERLIADFWQEAFILGQLHHPNVVAFYGVVPDGPDGTLATVTEFMVNGSLKQALQKKDRALNRRKRLLIAMDAAFGMEYLHKKNVVHFDLKCENLLVNLRDLQRPICKVGDLGLSKVKQQTMISGGVRGTLPWMAPELLNGSSSLVSEKVDVFSFGIVLWELLTGEEPYATMHYGAIIGGIVTNTLRPLVPSWCDPDWKSLMEACWAADPAERPTFSEIASSLRAMETTLSAKGQGQAPNVE